MNQAERIRKLRELDQDIERLEIRVDEAQARLRAAQDRREQITKGCTHEFASGKPAIDDDECRICNERDLSKVSV